MEFMYAKPVWAVGKSDEMNETCLFTAKIRRGEYRLRITACSVYRVFLDGEFAFYGPARSAHGYLRVDEYDFYIEKDVVSLTIEVNSYRVKNYYYPDQSPCLQAEAIGPDTVATGWENDFRCFVGKVREQKVYRFSYQRGFTECYTFTEDPATYYRTPSGEEVSTETVEQKILLPRKIGYPVYLSETASLTETGKARFQEDLPVYSDRYMWMKELGIFDSDEIERKPSDYASRLVYEKTPLEANRFQAGEYGVYCLEHSTTGFICIDFIAEEDARLFFIFDEIDFRETIAENEPIHICFYRNATCNVIDLQVKKGKNHFLSFEPYTARFLKVIVKEGAIAVGSVRMVKYENAAASKYKPKEMLPKEHREICLAAARTFAQNAVDILTDCPSRERAGWLCDSWFSARAEKLFTGQNEIEANFLENIALSGPLENVPDGMIPMCYPADFARENEYIPNWSMWWLLELYDYFQRTGDRTIAEISRPKAENLLRYFRRFENEYELLENLEGWIFVEWSKANDSDWVSGVNFPSNMLYAKALEAVARLYGEEELLKKSERIKQQIRELSFNGTFFEDNAVRADGVLTKTGHTSETCQYYAFFTDVAAPDTYPELWRTLLESFGPARDYKTVYPSVYPSNVFIGNYLRLCELDRYGRLDLVLKESVEYFGKMAERTGTLWEHDGISGSLNHGFASYIAVLLDK